MPLSSGAGIYLVSFFIPSFAMPSSDFVMLFFVLCFFLAFAFIGSLAFVASCPAGLVVWAGATDMLPTRATQHTARMKLRIFDLPIRLKELPITGHNRKGSIFGTQRDSHLPR
jgi:hypothetical protein